MQKIQLFRIFLRSQLAKLQQFHAKASKILRFSLTISLQYYYKAKYFNAIIHPLEKYKKKQTIIQQGAVVEISMKIQDSSQKLPKHRNRSPLQIISKQSTDPHDTSKTINFLGSHQNLKNQMMSSLRKLGNGSQLENVQDQLVASRLMKLQGQCKILEWEFIRINKVQAFFAMLLIIASVIGLFVLKYSAKFRKFAFFETVPQQSATYIFIKDNDNKYDIVPIENPSSTPLIFFYKKLKYSISNFNKRQPTPVAYQFQRKFKQVFDITRIKKGLTLQQVQHHKQLYGPNQHRVQTPSFPSYLLDVLTEPFFLLQYFFCFVFFLQGYAPFSIALLFFSFLTTTINYIMLYTSYKKIKEIAEKAMQVRVIREGRQEIIDSTQLVPGDSYIPQEQTQVAADCLVGCGDIYVNEANLTGQSIPIGKFQIQHIEQINTSNTWINQGSKILETKHNTYSIVINTGFTTHRGRIIRKILNRRVKDPDMLKSTGIFVAEVVLVSLVTFFATLYLQLVRNIEKLFVFFKFVDFLTSSAPPPLPIFFNLAYSLSLLRLGFKGILGTQPQKTVEGAQLLTFCFDKTGTLTRNQVRITKILKLTNNNTQFQNIISTLGDPSNIKTWQAFSTCHTTKIINNQLLGDQIDKQMFNFINASMESSSDPNVRVVVKSTKDMKTKQVDEEEQDTKIQEQIKENRKKIQSLIGMNNQQCLQVLRINQFQSRFQSMSVLVRDTKTDRYVIFAKGSPQKLLSQSINLHQQIQISSYTKMIKTQSLNGLRTIAYGFKELPKSQVQTYLKCDREVYLKQIVILGLVCFENKLKHDTKQTITRLNKSNIETKMITGDSLYIAVETGRRAGIISRTDKVVFLEGKNNLVSEFEEGRSELTGSNMGNNRIFKGTIINQIDIQNLEPQQQDRDRKLEEFEQKIIDISENQVYLNSNQYIFAIDNQFLTLTPSPYLSTRIKIFARIPPENKALIIKKYKTQQNQYIRNKFSKITRFLRTKNTKIGMCGDGANDLMALREADLSIGIQATDASYGSSFTVKNMLDVDQIIKQSKCAQANIIHLYQFYGTISMFVLITSIIMITDYTYFSTAQLMYLNFGTILIIPVTIALSKPSNQESQYVPDANMMGLHNHLIFWGNLLIPYAGILGSWFYYSNTSYYIPNSQKEVSIKTNGFNSKNQTTTLLFVLILITIAFNGFITYRSKPWRQRIYTNYILTFLLVITLTVAIFFAFFNDYISPGFQFEFINRWSMGICIFINLGSLILNFVYNEIVGVFRLQYKKLQTKIGKQQ